jgi:thiol-disulfide isomerase/thioredoxin
MMTILFAAAALRSADAGSFDSPAEQLTAIQREFVELQNRYKGRWTKESNTPAETDKIFAEFRKVAPTVIRKAVDLAESHPDDPAAVDALVWAVAGHGSGFSDQTDRAFHLLISRYIASDKLASVCRIARVFWFLSDAAREFEKAILDKSPHRRLRGIVCLGMSDEARGMARDVRWYKSQKGSTELEEWQRAVAPGYRKLVETGDAEQYERQQVELLERVIREFGDVKSDDADIATLGERASGKLARLRELAPGRPAPEVAAEDIDGQSLKLSDYRGKVVLLSYWASWCGPCMAAMPHERQLVERFKGRPFVILGVNGDSKRDAARNAAAKAGISWRSWWNGSADGPIPTRWGVDSWPAFFAIDHRGVIRTSVSRLSDMDSILDKLVAEAERDRK